MAHKAIQGNTIKFSFIPFPGPEISMGLGVNCFKPLNTKLMLQTYSKFLRPEIGLKRSWPGLFT